MYALQAMRCVVYIMHSGHDISCTSCVRPYAVKLSTLQGKYRIMLRQVSRHVMLHIMWRYVLLHDTVLDVLLRCIAVR